MCDWESVDIEVQYLGTQCPAEPLEYGDVVPGVTCPSCGGELVHTSYGAFCDECRAYVPVIGTAVHASDEETDWDDEG